MAASNHIYYADFPSFPSSPAFAVTPPLSQIDYGDLLFALDADYRQQCGRTCAWLFQRSDDMMAT